MADKFSNNRDQNEKSKFSADANGNTAVNVIDNGNAPKGPDGNIVPNKASGYIAAGTTNTPLLNGETFDTGVMDLDSYPYLASEVFSDVTGTGTPFTVYAGRGDLISISTIETTYIDLNIRSRETGGWTVSTGKDVQCIVIGE